MIYKNGQISGLKQDINMQFFGWTLWLQGYHPDHTGPVKYGYSWNIRDSMNFQGIFNQNDKKW